MTTIHSLKCAVPFSFIIALAATRCHSLSLFVTRFTTLHSLCCSLSFVMPLVVPLVMPLVVPLVTIRCHSLSLDGYFFEKPKMLELERRVFCFFLLCRWQKFPGVPPKKMEGALYHALGDHKFSPTSGRAEPNERV